MQHGSDTARGGREEFEDEIAVTGCRTLLNTMIPRAAAAGRWIKSISMMRGYILKSDLSISRYFSADDRSVPGGVGWLAASPKHMECEWPCKGRSRDIRDSECNY
jgi:hypothetical protein